MSSSFLFLLSKGFCLLEVGITQGLCQSAREAKKKENVFRAIIERVGRAHTEYPMLLRG
jgi:hypothetical protein